MGLETIAFYSIWGLLALMITLLALEEVTHIKKSLIATLCAGLALIIGIGCEILPVGGHHDSDSHHLPIYIALIDWEVIAIILGSSIFVDVVTRSGLFSYVAVKLTKKSGGSPVKLLVFYSILTVVFSALLNNVTAMIIVGTLSIVSLKKLGKENYLLPFLITEGLLTNIGGLLTLVSSVPNIIVGKKAGLEFLQFLVVSAPFVVVATAVTVVMSKRIFKITSDPQGEDLALMSEMIDEEATVPNKFFFFTSLVSLILLIVLFALGSHLPVFKHLGLGFTALAFGFGMLWAAKKEVKLVYQAVDWDLLFFFAGLFCLISVAGHAGVLASIGDALNGLMGSGEVLGRSLLLAASAGASAVTDNIPLSAVLAQTISMSQPDLPATSPTWWAIIYGSNLGGNLTPIGSASTMVAVMMMHKEKLPIGFFSFVVKALPFALVHIGLAIGYVIGLGYIFK